MNNTTEVQEINRLKAEAIKGGLEACQLVNDALSLARKYPIPPFEIISQNKVEKWICSGGINVRITIWH